LPSARLRPAADAPSLLQYRLGFRATPFHSRVVLYHQEAT
jgi:hypothetical protein